jgi:hypothetical protein
MAAVLQLADITRLTGIPANTARQWMQGRPYAIAASVRDSAARGVPKLFDAADALRFAVAAQLTRDGFTSRIIKSVLKKLDSFNGQHAATLTIAQGRVHFVDLIPSDMVARLGLDKKISVYILNLGSLRDELNLNIATRTQSISRDKRRNVK